MDLHFSIGPDTYNVPKHITVDVFQRAIAWDLEDAKNLKPFTATVVGCPLSALTSLEDEIFQFIAGVCLQLMQVPVGRVEKEIAGHQLIDFDTMTFANFIDLDTYTSSGVGINLGNIVALLYGVTIETASEWKLESVWPTVHAVTQWRQSVYKEYDEFFELADQQEASDEAKANNVGLQWWEACISLADEDFLKIHQVVERPYKECLNFLTWKKSQIQKQKLDNLRRKNDIQKRTR